jgi:hypothetical protein
MEPRKWVRWQDWVALVVGLVIALTPLWFDPGDALQIWTMVIVGGLLALAGIWSLAMPGAVLSEWIHAILGVLAFVAPWVVSYYDQTGAAWTSWAGGLIAVVVGLWAVRIMPSTHGTATPTTS